MVIQLRDRLDRVTNLVVTSNSYKLAVRYSAMSSNHGFTADCAMVLVGRRALVLHCRPEHNPITISGYMGVTIHVCNIKLMFVLQLQVKEACIKRIWSA